MLAPQQPHVGAAHTLAEERAQYLGKERSSKEVGGAHRDRALLSDEIGDDPLKPKILAGLAGRIKRWFYTEDEEGNQTSECPEGDTGIISAAAAHQITWAQYQAARLRGAWIIFYESADDEVGRIFPMPESLEPDELSKTMTGELNIHHARMIQFPNGVKMDEPIESDWDKYQRKLQVDASTGNNSLGFGESSKNGLINTDGMVVQIHDGEKWMEQSETVPLTKLALHPNMQAIHYGSALFEGMACERNAQGEICVFDLRGHYDRIMAGAEKYNMPRMRFVEFKEMIEKAIRANKRFIPPYREGRLYLRPNLVDIGPKMKVGNSKTVAMVITATPIGNEGSYFGHITEESIFGVPRQELRSAEGLAGNAKGAGNYAPTISTINLAKKLGLTGGGIAYLDRLVADSKPPNKHEHATATGMTRAALGFALRKGKQMWRMFNAEFGETNASNLLAFEKLEDDRWRIITPPLKGDILEGRTRALIKRLAGLMDWEFSEEPLRLRDIKKGRFEFMAGSGTAAYLTPIHGFQMMDVGTREELDKMDETDEVALAGEFESEDEKERYLNERIARKHGRVIRVAQRRLKKEELFPEPLKRLMKEMADAKRGESRFDEFGKDVTKVAI